MTSNSSDDRSISIGGNVSGTILNTGDNNKIALKMSNLPRPDDATPVNIAAELAALKTALLALNGAEAANISHALDDATSAANSVNPDKDKIGQALERAVSFAKKTAEFSTHVEKFGPHLVNAAHWLGAKGKPLLALAGINLIG